MTRRYLAAIVGALCFAAITNARETKVYMVKKSGAAEILSDKDHITITFVSGWVSQKDGVLLKIFSTADKQTTNVEATGTYFDGDQLKNAWVLENTDVSHHLDRPWGATNKDLLTDIPADTANVDLILKMTGYKGDRFKQIIDAFKGAQPGSPPAGFSLTVEPYLTYATIADSLLGAILGTSKTSYPFLMESGIVDNTVRSANGMYEHYLIAIAPNVDGDQWLQGIDGSKLSYDEASADLKYAGQSVKDHTYAVLWIGMGPRPDIPKMLFSSKAAWAVLALTDFYGASLPDINSKEDVPRFDKSLQQQLTACIDQLKRELRFSAFDRASALFAFSERSKKMISAACATKGIGAADCKTPQIDNFEDGINGIFGLTNPQTKALVPDDAKKLNRALNDLINLKLD
jgi:hypothetical protein